MHRRSTVRARRASPPRIRLGDRETPRRPATLTSALSARSELRYPGPLVSCRRCGSSSDNRLVDRDAAGAARARRSWLHRREQAASPDVALLLRLPCRADGADARALRGSRGCSLTAYVSQAERKLMLTASSRLPGGRGPRPMVEILRAPCEPDSASRARGNHALSSTPTPGETRRFPDWRHQSAVREHDGTKPTRRPGARELSPVRVGARRGPRPQPTPGDFLAVREVAASPSSGILAAAALLDALGTCSAVAAAAQAREVPWCASWTPRPHRARLPVAMLALAVPRRRPERDNGAEVDADLAEASLTAVLSPVNTLETCLAAARDGGNWRALEREADTQHSRRRSRARCRTSLRRRRGGRSTSCRARHSRRRRTTGLRPGSSCRPLPNGWRR